MSIAIQTSLYVGGWIESGKLVRLDDVHSLRKKWRSEILEGVVEIRVNETVFLGADIPGRVDVQLSQLYSGIQAVLEKGYFKDSILDPDRVYITMKLTNGMLLFIQESPLGKVVATVPPKTLFEAMILEMNRFCSVVAENGLSPKRRAMGDYFYCGWQSVLERIRRSSDLL